MSRHRTHQGTTGFGGHVRGRGLGVLPGETWPGFESVRRFVDQTRLRYMVEQRQGILLGRLDQIFSESARTFVPSSETWS